MQLHINMMLLLEVGVAMFPPPGKYKEQLKRD